MLATTEHATYVHPPEIKGAAPNHEPRTIYGPVHEPPLFIPELDGPLPCTFRHSGWHADRVRMHKALYRTKQSPSRRHSFAECGSHAYVYRSVKDPTVYRVMGSACRDRFCVPCTRERGQTLSANISERLAGQPARFMTFTLNTDGLDLAQSLDKLQKSFNRLLKQPAWRSRVTGGVAFLEVKYNTASSRWHPHVHAIVQGKYFLHTALREAWLRATGDSHIVDIRFVRSQRSVLHYVTTYCSKAHRSTDFPNDDRLDEAILALRGRRLARTFGNWRGAPLTACNTDTEWEPVELLHTLLDRAVRGDDDARTILGSLGSKVATNFLEANPRPPPKPPTVAPPTYRQSRFTFTSYPLSIN